MVILWVEGKKHHIQQAGPLNVGSNEMRSHQPAALPLNRNPVVNRPGPQKPGVYGTVEMCDLQTKLFWVWTPQTKCLELQTS